MERAMADGDRPTINVEKVCHIIVKARQFDAKEGAIEPAPASDPQDDGFREVLADDMADATAEELREFIAALDEDEQADVVALMWLGRGDFGREEWHEARRLAAERQYARTTQYLLTTPLLGDYLEEGLAAFDWGCAEFEAKNL
jgi:hypothetical protein